MPNRIERIEIQEEIKNINHHGGRPPKLEIKDNLKLILKELKGGTPGFITRKYYEQIGKNISPNTITKYLNILTDEKFLHKKILSDNKKLVDQRKKNKRRRVLIYRLMR